jgi:hypothetical protein
VLALHLSAVEFIDQLFRQMDFGGTSRSLPKWSERSRVDSSVKVRVFWSSKERQRRANNRSFRL